MDVSGQGASASVWRPVGGRSPRWVTLAVPVVVPEPGRTGRLPGADRGKPRGSVRIPPAVARRRPAFGPALPGDTPGSGGAEDEEP